eukprot:8882921-Pyramimonas_sp.AAC.1
MIGIVYGRGLAAASHHVFYAGRGKGSQDVRPWFHTKVWRTTCSSDQAFANGAECRPDAHGHHFTL